MTVATYSLLIDWNNDGVLTGTGEDVTAQVVSIEWERGRDFASQLTGRSKSGYLTAVLNNESGSYSPFNSASALAGSLLPGRKVQLQGGISGFPYTFPITLGDSLWTGYLEKIESNPSAKGLNTVTISAIGALGYLNRRQVSMPVVTSMTTGSAIGTILDKAGWGTARNLDTGQTTLDKFWTEKVYTIEALRKVEETESGFIVETKDGTIAFENRHHRLVSPHTASQAIFTDSSIGTLVYQEIKEEDPLPHIFNIFECVVQKYSVGTTSTLWVLSDTGTNSKIDRGGGSRTFWAQFPNPDSPTDAVAVLNWDTLTTADYSANSNPSGTGGTDVTANISIVQTQFANSQKLVITNNNNSLDAYFSRLQTQGTAISKQDPVKMNAEDSSSQTKYGQREYPNPAEWVPNTEEAQNWCDFGKSIYKDPIPVISITFSANKDSTHLDQAFNRDISDRITIVGTGSAGLGLNRDFFIECERHKVSADRTHYVTYDCSDAPKFSDFWVLGISRLGTNTKLAY